MRRWITACSAAVLALVCTSLAASAARADTSAPTATATATGIARADWSAGPVARGTGYMRPGGSRPVRELQRLLRARGLHPGPVDRLFGPRTERAVRRFQARRHLRTDAIAGRRTLTALRSTGARREVTHVPAGAPAPSPHAVPAPSGGPAPAPAPAAPQSPRLPVVALLGLVAALGLPVLVVSYLGTRRRVMATQGRAAPPPRLGGHREAAR